MPRRLVNQHFAGDLVQQARAYVGIGPALTDEKRRAVRVVLRPHEKQTLGIWALGVIIVGMTAISER